MFTELTQAEFERDKTYRRNRRIVVMGLLLCMDYLLDTLGAGSSDPRLNTVARGTVVVTGWLFYELANYAYNELNPLPRPGMHNAYGAGNAQNQPGAGHQQQRRFHH